MNDVLNCAPPLLLIVAIFVFCASYVVGNAFRPTSGESSGTWDNSETERLGAKIKAHHERQKRDAGQAQHQTAHRFRPTERVYIHQGIPGSTRGADQHCGRQEAFAEARPAAGLDTPDCLKALGLGRNATVNDVRKAYRRMAKTEHPDGGGTDQRFVRLQENVQASMDWISSR